MTRTALLAALLLATPAAAETVQERLLAGARAVSPEAIAFTRTMREEKRGGATAEVHSRVDRWDPARPAPQRWTLVSIDGRSPTSDEMVGAAEQYADAPVPSYGRLARWLGAKATCEAKTCRYPSLPKGILVINGHDMSADTTAEVTIGDGPVPWVERVRMTSTKGFRMMLVARIDKVETVQTFRMLPNGTPAPAEFVTDLTGAMMGKAGVLHNVTSFTEVRPAASQSH